MRITIGRYPAIGLSNARDTARQICEKASLGVDPRALSKEETGAQRPAPLFGQVADDFLRLQEERAAKANPLDRQALRPSTRRDYRRMLTIVAKPLRSLRIDEVTRRDVKKIIDELEITGRLAQADQTVAYVGRFFRWAVEEEIIERSPMESLRGRRRLKSRERVLSRDELVDITRALDRIEYPFGPLLRILLLSGQRRGEVAGMRWDEISDWETGPVWELPGTRTKNRLPHIVPIVQVMKEVIDGCPRHSDLVFTARGSLLSGFAKVKRVLNERIVEVRAARGINTVLPHWVLHDFRRSFSTHAHETLGIDPHVVEAVLNHVSGTKASVAGVYNRAQYLDERRLALEAWSEWIGAK